MTEISAKAFLSYARLDNEREGGRIVRLATKIREEFETLTGTTIEIFVDSAEIRWGENFRQKLDEALQDTAFFIPVLTPTYFLREECRKEMTAFVSSAKALGAEELLLSLRYVDVRDMTEDSTDELKSLAALMQFEPWNDLRLKDETSEEYRSGVNRLASRLVDLTAAFEVKPGFEASIEVLEPSARSESSGSSSRVRADEDADDEPGTIDLLAELEPSLEAWGDTLTQIGPTVEEINQLFSSATAEMTLANQKPKSFPIKVQISRDLAAAVEDPLSRLEDLTKSYVVELSNLDPKMRALLSVAEQGEAADAVEALEQIRGLALASEEASKSFTQAADAARANSGASKDLRPVLRRFETALRNVVDARSLIASWGSVAERLLG